MDNRIINATRSAAIRFAMRLRNRVTTAAISAAAGPAAIVLGAAASAGDQIVAHARSVLGVPYAIGTGRGKWPRDGSMPSELDCSGLTEGAYRLSGISIPHGSRNQRKAAAEVDLEQLEIGDLVFKHSKQNNQVHHVGIYVGNGTVIHAPKTGDVVKEVPLSVWTSSGERISAGRIA